MLIKIILKTLHCLKALVSSKHCTAHAMKTMGSPIETAKLFYLMNDREINASAKYAIDSDLFIQVNKVVVSVVL